MRPTEKKAIIRSGASESVKNRDAVSPKKLVANKRLTTTASGNTLAGYAAAPAGNGAVTVALALNA